MTTYLATVLLQMLLISSVLAQRADTTVLFLGDWQDKSVSFTEQCCPARTFTICATADLGNRLQSFPPSHGFSIAQNGSREPSYLMTEHIAPDDPQKEEKAKKLAAWRVKTMKPMIDDLRKVVEYGKQFGVIIGIQNHGDFLKTADETIELLKAVDSDWIGLIVDTGYFNTPDCIELTESTDLLVSSAAFQGNARSFGKGWDNDWAIGFDGPGDSVSWNLDLPQAATYEISVLHTAKKAGGSVEARVGSNRIRSEVSKVYDPPEIPRPDLVTRWEVPDKIFQRLSCHKNSFVFFISFDKLTQTK